MGPTWCMSCALEGRHTHAATLVDGDPMCDPCAKIAARPVPDAEKPPARSWSTASHALCDRGCGKPPHRGACAGRVVTAPDPEEPCKRGCGKLKHAGSCPGENRGNAGKPKPQSAPVIATVCGLETMTAETRDALGQLARSACNAFRVVKRADLPAVKRRESFKLNRRVFAAMVAARPEAIEVPVDGWKAGVNLRRRLQLLARPRGLEIDWSRSPDFKTFYFWLIEGEARL